MRERVATPATPSENGVRPAEGRSRSAKKAAVKPGYPGRRQGPDPKPCTVTPTGENRPLLLPLWIGLSSRKGEGKLGLTSSLRATRPVCLNNLFARAACLPPALPLPPLVFGRSLFCYSRSTGRALRSCVKTPSIIDYAPLCFFCFFSP